MKVNGIIFTSRVLDGAFPAYGAIIPKKYEINLKVNSAVLLQTLKLASLFSRDSAYSTKFEINKKVLKVTAISPTLGDNTNEIAIDETDVSDFIISANAQYLIEALNVLSNEINLHFIDSKSPIVITSPKDESYLYLVMPLRSE